AAERTRRDSLWRSLRRILWTPLLAMAVAIAVPAASRLIAAPILVLWALSPLAAHLLSRPRTRQVRPLDRVDRRELRRLARKTWAFFESVVGPEDHWLPPDNLQEYPRDKVAHRMSPTNEGLFVLSAVAAHDFGFLGVHNLTDLLERNLQ